MIMTNNKYSVITDDNYESYALSHYNNPQCTGVSEFQEDLEERPKWIKRLLRRYHKGGELRERLLLNHIIVFINVFGVEAGTKLLFYKIENSLHGYLKTFLIYLNYYREAYISYLSPKMIPIDEHIQKRLEDID